MAVPPILHEIRDEKFTAADVHCLNAAEGWLELGNYLEADGELDHITPQLRAHPIVLQMRWRVYAQARKLDMCVEIASTLTRMNEGKNDNIGERQIRLARKLKAARWLSDAGLQAVLRKR